MDFNAIIKRVMNLILKPDKEWDKIQGESMTIKDLFLKYALLVYALPYVAMLIGMLISGLPFGIALGMSIVMYILTIGALILIGLLIDVIGPQFGGKKDMLTSQMLAVFSLTPYAVIGILSILPLRFGGFFYLIMFISLYSFYIMYVGAPKLKNIAQDKLIPFIAIMAVIWLVLIYIVQALSSEIAWRMFVGSIRTRF